jgi:hypothetical protein
VETADDMVADSIMCGSSPRRKIARDRKNDIEFLSSQTAAAQT